MSLSSRVAVAVALAVLTGLVTVPSSAVAGERVQVRLQRAVELLPVARETRRGYDRDKFRHWVDADGDCRDTRDEVLADESRTAVAGCDVRAGRWRSYYDRVVVHDSAELDVDHVVALAEAWDSGAKRWNARTRERFANDLGDRRSLVAVTASTNRSKSDRDPAEWLPAFGRCRFLRHWVAVKTRWSLTVDQAEKRALRHEAGSCQNVRITVSRARIGMRRATGGSGPVSGGGTDPRYDYCYEAVEDGYGPYYRGRDPEYDWYTDADDDGVVCES